MSRQANIYILSQPSVLTTRNKKDYKMAKFKIKIVEEQHFIEGNRYHAFLMQEQGENNYEQMIIACNVKPNGYLDMCEKLGGLKFRLESLGNEVETFLRFDKDPNFETEEEANEYLMNKGE